MKGGALVFGVGLASVVALLASASCARQTVDLGQNDGSPLSPAVAAGDANVFPSGYGCANWLDSQLTTLRGTTCTGGCTDGLGPLYALASQEELEAATAGQWLYCGAPSFGPTDAVGLEFSPGCRVYFLVHDANGDIVRGTLAAYQASFDIYDLSQPGAPKRIDLNLRGDGGATTEETHTFDVRVSACPNKVELIDLAGNVAASLSSDFGDAGRPPGVVK